MDTSIKYHPELNEDDVSVISSIFVDLCNRYNHIERKPLTTLVGSKVSIMSSPIGSNKKVGSEALVIASNNEFCLVKFRLGDYNFYRCEDVVTVPKPVSTYF